MKSKQTSAVLSFILTLIITALCSVPCAECAEYTADEVRDLVGGIISYKLSESDSGDIQGWINGKISEDAGVSSDWYAISLSQYGNYDFTAYENRLSSYLESGSSSSASSRLKYALALSASGSRSSRITDLLDSSAGQQGIMSWIYALHILNNGYESSVYSREYITDTLLSLQYPDGGWALFGDYGDTDVTAMTISALAPQYSSRNDVRAACDRGTEFLSVKQQDDGGFTSFGTANPESASQVLTALSSLGINCCSDERFIKNGCTVIDGIVKYRLEDGSFRHLADGPSNDTATVQALYSLISFTRMTEGKSPLFILDNRKPVEAEISTVTAEPQTAPPSEAMVSEESKADETSEVSSPASSSASEASENTVASSAGSTAPSPQTELSLNSAVMVSETVSDASVISETVIGPAPASVSGNRNSSFRITAVIIIISAAMTVNVILTVRGRKNKKNFIFTTAAAALLAVIVLITDIRSPEQFYRDGGSGKENITGTVTLEIRCDTITGKSDAEYIPADGTVLEKTEFQITEGETVFDVLTEAAAKFRIQTECSGSAGNAHGMTYVAGINYIYEFDFGDLSGWVYHVNGKAPSVGCGEYTVNDGDCIEWLYTCDLGHDLGEVYE